MDKPYNIHSYKSFDQQFSSSNLLNSAGTTEGETDGSSKFGLETSLPIDEKVFRTLRLTDRYDSWWNKKFPHEAGGDFTFSSFAGNSFKNHNMPAENFRHSMDWFINKSFNETFASYSSSGREQNVNDLTDDAGLPVHKHYTGNKNSGSGRYFNHLDF